MPLIKAIVPQNLAAHKGCPICLHGIVSETGGRRRLPATVIPGGGF